MERASTSTPLLDWSEAATYLATSERHLRRLVQERRIPHVLVGGKVRFARSDIDTYITLNRR